METELTKDKFNQLKNRFGNFSDGMIYHVELDLMKSPAKMKIIVEAHDWDTAEELSDGTRKTETVKVIFEIEGLTQYIIRQPENFQQVLIYQLNIAFFDEYVYLDFNPTSADPNKREYYTTESLPNTNQLFVAGRKCLWSIDENL